MKCIVPPRGIKLYFYRNTDKCTIHNAQYTIVERALRAYLNRDEITWFCLRTDTNLVSVVFFGIEHVLCFMPVIVDAHHETHCRIQRHHRCSARTYKRKRYADNRKHSEIHTDVYYRMREEDRKYSDAYQPPETVLRLSGIRQYLKTQHRQHCRSEYAADKSESHSDV